MASVENENEVVVPDVVREDVEVNNDDSVNNDNDDSEAAPVGKVYICAKCNSHFKHQI